MAIFTERSTLIIPIDRGRSQVALTRHVATLARLGVAVDVPRPEAELVRRMREYRRAAADKDALIKEGTELGMSDAAIGRNRASPRPPAGVEGRRLHRRLAGHRTSERTLNDFVK